MGEKQRKYALLGGLCGLAYLVTNGILSDFLLGVLLGAAVLCFVAALLPEKQAKKMRKWKRRGE